MANIHSGFGGCVADTCCTCSIVVPFYKIQQWSAGKQPSLRRGSTFTFRSPRVAERDGSGGGSEPRSPGAHSLRRTISVPVTSTSRDTAPLAFHAKVHGASRAAVAGIAAVAKFLLIPLWQDVRSTAAGLLGSVPYTSYSDYLTTRTVCTTKSALSASDNSPAQHAQQVKASIVVSCSNL